MSLIQIGNCWYITFTRNMYQCSNGKQLGEIRSSTLGKLLSWCMTLSLCIFLTSTMVLYSLFLYFVIHNPFLAVTQSLLYEYSGIWYSLESYQNTDTFVTSCHALLCRKLTYVLGYYFWDLDFLHLSSLNVICSNNMSINSVSQSLTLTTWQFSEREGFPLSTFPQSVFDFEYSILLNMI